ncbi:MAG: bifunctional (p)ppGpp synthetase/guanosine-3',5'-bis(diphosphate) 3'-pyrophosphohydrolase [Candidatus Diapherotrites archaeon]|uniref:Bifunctional (P)ppGpp synthetase/guanosine-3',5'-bis(Diphosphate) 3'-pyrophosphohydrolase n=1 Tax=Candidatus Iainarchaeum sp. TaxID=3101447 RepID=A0A8T4L233_9ARCH|nr:bifunctional (p)ppGpp synthetase/guanosine-3',5'-bis(diphosphate) 3'-pyrophosphohydrolase [Candidatus Diapherotrites archaeon]
MEESEIRNALREKALKELLKIAAKHNRKLNVKLIAKAFAFAKASHRGQKRLSEKPYFSHPFEAAKIVASLGLDAETISAALLHDVIEDADADRSEIEREFGKQVYFLVDGVTKLGVLSHRTREQRSIANLQKIILASVKDIRILVVKLADKLHNMRTLKYLPKEKRQRVAAEVLSVHAPLAHKLGMHTIKDELEELAYDELNPKEHSWLSKEIRSRTRKKEVEVGKAISIMKKAFAKQHLKARFGKYYKNCYTINKKLRKQSKGLDEIYDFVIIKIIVGSIPECYRALGVVHNTFLPLPKKMKDYIAIPQTNFYQAIHTSVIGPKGTPIKVYIATREMNNLTERGIAAGWHLRDKKLQDILRQNVSKLNKIANIEDVGRLREFGNAFKTDFLQKTIFVFTPSGETRELPAGSTPIDFAFNISAQLGERCLRAKANGKSVPLWKRLESGDIVEIIPSAKRTASRLWLSFAKSEYAKKAIADALKSKKSRKDENQKAVFAKIKICAIDRIGLFSDIAKCFSANKINIVGVQTGASRNKAIGIFSVQLTTPDKLENSLSRIKAIGEITDVKVLK